MPELQIKNLHVTDLTAFQSCRRKFYFDKVLRIKRKKSNFEVDEQKLAISPETDPKFPLTFGSAGHKVLEEWYADRIPFYKSLPKYFEFIRPDFVQIAESLFAEYEVEYKNDFEDYHIEMVETPIHVEFEVDGYTFTIELNMDVMLRSNMNSARFAMDHKFMSSFISQDEMNMRDQFTAYVACVRKAGISIHGLITNQLKKVIVDNPTILKKGELSLNMAQATTYHKYKQQVDIRQNAGEDVSKYDAILEYLRTKEHPSLKRTTVVKTAGHTERWEQLTKVRVMDIRRALDIGEEQFYPTPDRHCLKCEFLQICQSQLQGGTGAGYIATNFETKKDDER